MKRTQGLHALVAVATLVASGCQGTAALAASPEMLTEFQWALVSRGTLLLIPIKDFLYPARIAGEGQIETRPARIPVTLYESGQKVTPILQSVVSPFELNSAHWVAQKRVEGQWVDVQSFVFVDGKFYLMESPASLTAVDLAVLRFAPVKQP